MKIKQLGVCLCLAVPTLVFCGCAALKGAPNQTPSASKQRKVIAAQIDIDTIMKSYEAAEKAGDDQTMITIRNDYIDKTLLLYNSNFTDWTTSTAFEQNSWDTLSKVAVLGVDAAGTLVGAQESKAILAAISGGITGSTELVDKNFFYQKTMPSLVSAMNAAREKDLTPIRKGEGETPEQYSLGTAMDDLNKYFYDGTFLGALDYITKTSGSNTGSSQDTNAVLSATKSSRLETSIKQMRVNKLLLTAPRTTEQENELQELKKELPQQ